MITVKADGRREPHECVEETSSRDILEEHLTRHDIDREEYVDRRKALDHITAIV